ncbi:hypothetical protein [Chryseobacterium aquaticum]|uniref:Uncharacterized protein n=1 Tax=Chryseobacterium aquaticum subsp. greenlandense TaxID=345663 RepID=A0A101CI96_9FLAO|nr:hypothetical protein [Chryseobacterium aquaticum]KUJ56719.1 hypothetical protein AR686_09195 [Chryseobacterium aquaticum subsp. greenlandense]
MKQTIIYFLKSIGFYNTVATNPFNYIYSDYENIPDNDDKVIQHKEFLKNLLDEERARLENIEGKTTQLISQTSLIISLISLFIPILLEKSNDLSFLIKIFFVTILISTYFFYILTIINALKNYNIKKFQYSFPNPTNVLIFKDKPINKFNEEVIRDYLYSININQKLNNVKGSNVLYSYNSFKVANILLSFLVISVCFISFFQKNENQKIEIISPVKIKLNDPLKLENRLIKDTIYIIQRDTIYLKK